MYKPRPVDPAFSPVGADIVLARKSPLGGAHTLTPGLQCGYFIAAAQSWGESESGLPSSLTDVRLIHWHPAIFAQAPSKSKAEHLAREAERQDACSD